MRLFPDKYEGEYEVLLPEPLPKPKVLVPTRPDVQPRVVVPPAQRVDQPAEPVLDALAEEVVVPEVLAEPAPAVQAGSVPTHILDDAQRRLFLKGVAVFVVGAFATTLFPRRADALVMGSTPGTGVVGLKDASNARINPATEETLDLLREGTSVLKKTVNLSSSGTVHTPASGKKVRVYNTRFSLDANLTSVSFRFTAGGTDYEKYLSPRLGGLYGTKNHPNYVEGGVDEVVYCVISGTANVQVNVDYLEV